MAVNPSNEDNPEIFIEVREEFNERVMELETIRLDKSIAVIDVFPILKLSQVFKLLTLIDVIEEPLIEN